MVGDLFLISLVLVLATFATEARLQEYISVGEKTVELAVRDNYRSKREAIKDSNKNGLTDADRKLFLNKHNELRSSVSNPTASDMIKLKWDPDLESMAQEWAEKCTWKHGQPDRDSQPYKNLGQNMWKGNGGYNIDGSVQSWFNEVQWYTYSSLSCDTGKVCGHYTQVARAKSEVVGCGVATCDNSGKEYWMIVCNYGPPGGKRPYQSGSSCSACPDSHQDGCENNLCTKSGCRKVDCNAGSIDPDTCACKCPEGVTGALCSGHVCLVSPVMLCAMMLKLIVDLGLI